MTYTAQIALIPHPHTPVEYAIDVVTHSGYHHCVLGLNEKICLSAEIGGAKVRYISEYPDAVWSRFDLDEEQTDDIVSWGYRHIGTPYGLLTDALIGVSLITGIPLPQWAEDYLSSDRIMECAQLCATAYEYARTPIFSPHEHPGVLYPGSYVPIWETHGWLPTK